MSAVLVKRSTKPVKHPLAAVNMDQTALLAHLQALTGDLDPGDAGPADLHDLRRRLAASLRDLPGETPPDVATLPEESCLASQLKLAVAESPAERVPEGSRLFVVRRQAALDLQGLVSSASNPLAGQAPAKVFGPFSDELRNPVWFDEFLIGPTNQIVWTGHAEITLVVPAALVLPATRKLGYGECSIWVVASALTHSAPAGAYAGWKVKKATLEFSAAGTVSGHKLTLPGNATCHLTMTPDSTEDAAPPAGPGADAAAASLDRPDSAEVFFSGGAVTAIRASSASVTVFGIPIRRQARCTPQVFRQ